jgi:hypothetical protein
LNHFFESFGIKKISLLALVSGGRAWARGFGWNKSRHGEMSELGGIGMMEFSLTRRLGFG